MKNPGLNLTPEQRTAVDALCEHDLVATGVSGKEVLLGCTKCPAKATRPATSRKSEITWDRETVPSITLVRVLVCPDSGGGDGDSPEDWGDLSEDCVITPQRIRSRYGIGKSGERCVAAPTFDALQSNPRGASVASVQALIDLVELLNRLDDQKDCANLASFQAQILDIGDFGPMMRGKAWKHLRSLITQAWWLEDGRLDTIFAVHEDVPQSHDAFKAALYLGLQSLIDANWAGEDGDTFFADDDLTELKDAVDYGDIETCKDVAEFREGWVLHAFYIYDHSGLSLSSGRTCMWDSSFGGYFAEKVREGETREAAQARAVRAMEVYDAHLQGQYSRHQDQTLTIYRPSDLDCKLEWEDGECCGGYLWIEYDTRFDGGKESHFGLLKYLKTNADPLESFIDLGVLDAD